MAANTTTTLPCSAPALAGPVIVSATTTISPKTDPSANRSKKAEVTARLHCAHVRAHMHRLQQPLGHGLPSTKRVPQRTKRAVSVFVSRKRHSINNAAAVGSGTDSSPSGAAPSGRE